MARALAPSPTLILLDEPFSALDAGLRAQLRDDIREALRADHATAVLVTHDQDEALSLADHVAVMAEGAMAMQGTPEDVYRRPNSLTVARFVGEVTELPGVAAGGSVCTVLGELPLRADQATASGPGLAVLRPEQIAIDPTGAMAMIQSIRYFGRDTDITAVVWNGSQSYPLRCRTSTPAPPSGAIRLRVNGVVSFFAEQL